MESLNDHVQEYRLQLSKGHIQKAYKGIMDFMADLRSYLARKYPDHTVSTLYVGYMDMTYFAFTPAALKAMKLKIAIVFLHETGTFELWLAGNNRQIQAEYIESLSQKNIGNYSLSEISPGVDSVIASLIVEQPDFDHPDALKKLIEAKTIHFADDIAALLRA